jgi:branched-chain amino acid transport system substrate-binding protein
MFEYSQKGFPMKCVKALLITCVVLIATSASGFAQETIKIGWIGSLSGVLAPYGLDHKRGVEFAVSQVNDAGGIDGKKLEVIYVDSRFDTAFAVQSVQRFALQDKVVAVIGDISSALTVAEVPITQRFGIPQVAGLAGTPKITDMGSKFIFRPYASVVLTYGTLAPYAVNKLGITKFATLAYDDEGGLSSIQAFKDGIAKAGKGEIVASEVVPVDTKEFRATIEKLRQQNPEALVIAAAAPVSGLIAKQVREAGWNVKLLGHGGYQGVPEFEKVAGPAAEGMIIATTYAPGYYKNPEAVKFEKMWKDTFKEEPRDLEAHGWDSLMLIADAIKKGGPSPKAIRDQLAATKGWPGAAGIYTFLDNGDLVKDLVIQEWKGGKLQPIEVYTPGH